MLILPECKETRTADEYYYYSTINEKNKL